MMNFVINIYYKHKEMINYIIVGGLTTVVSLSVYYGCVLTFLNPNNSLQLQVANIFSWIAAVTFAYIMNRKYVFESKNKKKLFEALSFFGSRVSTLILDMLSMSVMVIIIGINDKIAKLLVQIIVMIVNYLLSKFIVFRKN